MRSRPSVVTPAVVLLLFAVLLLGGCAASAHLTDMWSDPEAGGPAMRRTFVFAMERDEAKRRIMEDAFVSALTKRGVTADPSYRLFPASVPDSGVIQDAIEHGNYDGVIAISRLSTQTQTNYVPGYTTTETRTRYNPWTGRYRTSGSTCRIPDTWRRSAWRGAEWTCGSRAARTAKPTSRGPRWARSSIPALRPT